MMEGFAAINIAGLEPRTQLAYALHKDDPKAVAQKLQLCNQQDGIYLFALYAQERGRARWRQSFHTND